MAEEKKAKQKTDDWFSKIEKYLTKTISSFVASLFLLFGIGALFGASIISTQHSWLIFSPFALALLAYYSRDFALVGLIVFAAFLFI